MQNQEKNRRFIGRIGQLMDIDNICLWEINMPRNNFVMYKSSFVEHIMGIGGDYRNESYEDFFVSYMHPDDFENVREAMLKVVSDTHIPSIYFRIRNHKTNKWVPVRANYTMEQTENGINIIGTLKMESEGDITRLVYESDERTRLLLDNNPTVCMIFKITGEMLDCNEAACSLFGIDDRDYIINHFGEFSPEYQDSSENSAKMIIENMTKTYKYGKNVFYWTHQNLQKEQLPVKVTLVPVKIRNTDYCAAYLEDQRPIRSMLYAIQEAKNEASENMQLMLDMSPLASDVWDDQNRMIMCNRAAYELFGLDCVEEYCEKFFTLSKPVQPNGKTAEEYAMECVNHTIENGECQFFWIHMKPDGEEIPAHVTLRKVEYYNSYRIMGYIRDLREEFKANEAAREVSEQNRIMTEMNPISTTFWDEKFNMIDCNSSALKLFGVESKAELKRDFLKFSAEYQNNGLRSDELHEIYSRVCIENGSNRFEWLHKNKDGEIIPVEIIFIRVSYKGNYHIVSYMRDLRAEKAMIEAIEKARRTAEDNAKAKSDFLANMSHEIRTPMNAIIGMSDLLLYEELTEKQQRYVNDINISSTNLLGIINNILDFSKIESGRLELVETNYSLRIMLNNIASTMKFIAEKKGLEFIVEFDENIPDCLFGDDVKLRQSLLNLLGNSVKFTKEGYVMLCIRLTDGTPPNNKNIEFIVKDTGIGVKKENFRKLFAPFEQLDKIENKNVEGTGLGLVITKKIITMMHGDITVESVYGEGTAFTITIPLIAGDADDYGIIANQKFRFLKTKDVNILVVDDIEANLIIARAILEMSGINCDLATSGRQAIEMVQENDYDMVFMDHMMPEMDGIEATAKIRQLGGRFEKLRIIALTANAVTGMREKMLEAKMNGFLSKPIDKDSMNNILTQFLPEKKILGYYDNSESGSEKELSRQIRAVSELDGMNTAEALDRLNGNQDIYNESLRFFIVQTPRQKANLVKFMAERDYRNFKIEIHGAKGYLATIGAGEISEKAQAMETAAKNDDIEFCINNLPPFLSALDTLHAAISAIYNPPSEKAEATGDLTALAASVTAIKDAIDSFDLDTAQSILLECLIYSYNEKIDPLLCSLKEKIEFMDYDGAAALCGLILE